VTTAADPLLSGRTPLGVGDAAAAIILVDGAGYLMQLRDARPDIWYPGHWGLFGGALDPGEDPETALARELREELELDMPEATYFAGFDFDLGGLALPRCCRRYYLVRIDGATLGRLVLHEGAAMRVFTGEEILSERRVSPYDHFALFLHYSRARLAPPAAA
jgi:8-oxo-dGTP pyrophosphatase MutT (NUDIX family)